MKPEWKRWLADWIPPHLRARRRSRGDGAVRYSGRYTSWEEARRNSRGYDAPEIVEKVRASALKVLRGEAACERDSMVFDCIQNSFPLVVGLLRAALANGSRLSVVDIGGSLGSTYFQSRGLLAGLDVRWQIVEQPAYVAAGRATFADERLRFFEDLDAALAESRPDAVLMSSVLPYVPDPHELLDAVARAEVPTVIIDRTPVWSNEPDRLTVQSVPPAIYGFPASYPAWILNREGVLKHLLGDYRLLVEFEALAGRIDVEGMPARDTGFVLERDRSRRTATRAANDRAP
jgi:putative methyltransferase (TIGR04325 family)